MYKDPTEFRERFAKWKAGEKPYKNGRISDEEYVRIMEKVAADNWQKWGEDSEDAALTRILNDNAYDYRGYYSKYPNSAANADTHWSDEFKTVWHPTFSQESIYSGKKSQFNPYGYPGGTWQGEFFNPQWYQLNQHSPGFYKDGYLKLPKFATGTEGSGVDVTPLVNFGVGMIPVVGSAVDTWQAIKDPSLVNIGTAAAGWGLDAMMLLGPAGFAARLAIKAAIKTKKAINAGKSLYRINKTRSVAKRETVKAINTALTKNRQVDAGLQLAQEAYNKYAE